MLSIAFWRPATFAIRSRPPSLRCAVDTSSLQKFLAFQITGNGHGLSTLGLDQFNDIIGVRLFLGKIVDDDVGPFARIGTPRRDLYRNRWPVMSAFRPFRRPRPL